MSKTIHCIAEMESEDEIFITLNYFRNSSEETGDLPHSDLGENIGQRELEEHVAISISAGTKIQFIRLKVEKLDFILLCLASLSITHPMF
jgi:hypothetical protein